MQQQNSSATNLKAADILTDQEYEAYRLMRERKALVPIDEALLPRGGWLINGCEDGDRAPEAIYYHRSIIKARNGQVVCTHLPLIVGGPASADPRCPFFYLTYKGSNVAPGNLLLYARIEAALKAKPGKIPNFANQPHCLCGMCRLHSVSVWDNFLYTIGCKDGVRAEFPKDFLNHAVLPHFDLTGYPEAYAPPGPQRTYYLDRSQFEKLAQQKTSSHQSTEVRDPAPIRI